MGFKGQIGLVKEEGEKRKKKRRRGRRRIQAKIKLRYGTNLGYEFYCGLLYGILEKIMSSKPRVRISS